ncbi:hypothetical protein ACJBLB_01920 [Acinetobacter junii]|uniref:hypothetical protein n=1 Tax=Acinetobacter junii TaxID=40215 RepID=UPI00386248C4
MRRFKSLHLAMLTLGSLCLNSAYASDTLHTLSDSEMSAATGQSLFSLSYLAPTDGGNLATDMSGNKNIGFYRFGMEAELQLNANIKNLQLGCGGVNGAGVCDIDIKNLSLSGLNDSEVATGNNTGSPVFSNDRAATSAKLTNPFMELAIKNPHSAATREVVGFRLSAESMEGLLSAGLDNGTSPSTTDGIQSLSGYLQVASTSGHVYTKPATFGKALTSAEIALGNCLPQSGGLCQALGGKVKTLLGDRYFRSLPADSTTKGITVPSLKVDFNLPAFTINGTRKSQAIAENVSASIPWLPIAAPSSCPTAYAAACATANTQINSEMFANDLLYVLLTKNGNTTTWPADCVRLIACLVDNAKFGMAAGSAVTDLNIDITFKQSLSMFHNIPLKGTGGYLSSQSQDLRWPGANSDDIAQRGWWLSFAQPVELGYLEPQNQVDVSAVLPQVANYVTEALLAGAAIDVSGLGDTVTALTNNVLSKQLVIDVSSSPAAQLTLENQQLRSQHLVANCYGGLKFC